MRQFLSIAIAFLAIGVYAVPTSPTVQRGGAIHRGAASEVFKERHWGYSHSGPDADLKKPTPKRDVTDEAWDFKSSTEGKPAHHAWDPEITERSVMTRHAMAERRYTKAMLA
ncbi:hypothetical protein QBC41DRAFT_308378 [Cercophora samala]|uniref:Uncharacterized protein n=1 Tax=Cercophora samala TaxID=330535 RepID=A0AA39YM63_9PEZI|nr:hypothetical protein QBC41DRAFT_308378 [Cercophora samala]